MLVLRLRHLRTTALNAACGLRVANLVSLLSDKPKDFVQKKKKGKKRKNSNRTLLPDKTVQIVCEDNERSCCTQTEAGIAALAC